MAESVIDSLVVTLGLDSRNFNAGIENSTRSLGNFITRIGGMFVAFRGIEGVIDYWKDLHYRLAAVGFEARRLGQAATDLSQWGEVSRRVGGQASDATQSIEGFQAAIFSLKYKGQMSEQLAMLQRFGVAYLDAQGRMRGFGDIANDAAKAIDRQGNIGEGEKRQLALSFGFSGGVATAIAQGGKGLEAALAQAAKDQKALTDKAIQANTKFEQNQISREYRRDAANAVLVTKMLPAIDRINEKITELIQKAIPMLISAIDRAIEFFKNPPAWLKAIHDTLGTGGTLAAGITALIVAVSAGGALVTTLGTLTTALGTFVSSILAALGPAGLAVGAGAGLGAGIDWLDDKFTGGKILSSHSWLGSHLGALLPGVDYDPNAHNFTSAQLKHPAIATPGASRASNSSNASTTENGGKPSTSVVFENVVIQPRTNDAQGFSTEFVEQTRRKMLVANSDGGQG